MTRASRLRLPRASGPAAEDSPEGDRSTDEVPVKIADALAVDPGVSRLGATSADLDARDSMGTVGILLMLDRNFGL